MPTEPSDPTIRPAAEVPPHPAAPRPDSRSAGLVTIVVGIAGVLLGYLLGASGDTTGADSPVSVDAGAGLVGLSEPDPSPLRSIADLPDAGAESTSTSTSRTTATVPVEPAQILRDQIPLLAGRQLVGIGNGEAFLWRAGSRQPQVIDLPSNTWAQWNDPGRHLAYIKYEPTGASFGSELWLSYQGREPQPLWIGAMSFAWHPTEDKISWIGLAPPGDTWQLMWGDVTAYGVDNIGVHDLGIEADFEQAWGFLVGYGDYGWVVTQEEWDQEAFSSRVTTIMPDGARVTSDVVGERYIQNVSPAGHILFGGQFADDTVWSEVSMSTFEPAALRDGFYAIHWAPETGQMLAYRDTGSSTTAVIADGFSDEGTTIPTPPGGYPPTMSPDGETALAVVHETFRETTVYVFEPGSSDWSVLRIPGQWWFVDIGG